MLKTTTIATGKQNAYLLDNGETKLQIDMGVPFKQLKEMPDFVIYSHKHSDHFTNEKTYRKKLNVIDFTKQYEAKRLGSYYVQSIRLRHGAKEWSDGFVIRDMLLNQIYIFAIDFSEYRELANAANLFSNGYREPIRLIMCELHHSEHIVAQKAQEVFWASRRHCGDELFKAFISNFAKDEKRKVVAMHTNSNLFDFHCFKCDFDVSFAKVGKTVYVK